MDAQVCMSGMREAYVVIEVIGTRFKIDCYVSASCFRSGFIKEGEVGRPLDPCRESVGEGRRLHGKCWDAASRRGDMGSECAIRGAALASWQHISPGVHTWHPSARWEPTGPSAFGPSRGTHRSSPSNCGQLECRIPCGGLLGQKSAHINV